MKNKSHSRSKPKSKRSPQEQLIADSRDLGAKLLPMRTAREKLEKAHRYSDGFFGPEKWKAWKWLIRNHRRARKQMQRLDRASEQTESAKTLDLAGKQLDKFISSYSNLVEKDTELKQLRETISKTRDYWSEIVNQIRRNRPRISLTQAFLNLSDKSRIQIASLFIAALIFFGALHMAFYYEAAAGQSAVTYWTLNDLVIQGFLVVPHFFLALFFLELLFFYFFWPVSKRSYQTHSFLMRHPNIPVLLFCIFVASGITAYGYMNGSSKFSNFVDMVNTSNLQMATVMDDTVLRDVFLVGTTEKAAIFLRATNNPPTTADRPGFVQSAKCVASAFLPFGNCNREASSDRFEVFVMDRALIVCHAQANRCEVNAEAAQRADDP